MFLPLTFHELEGDYGDELVLEHVEDTNILEFGGQQNRKSLGLCVSQEIPGLAALTTNHQSQQLTSNALFLTPTNLLQL